DVTMKPIRGLPTWGFAAGGCLTVTLRWVRCHGEAVSGVADLGFCDWWLLDRDIAPGEMSR
ncbi:hypothetical protein, partial [Corynebacterium sanguinis]|uniref:hypothetical protein n=1 Tax=Corynebacterium sanguinis TaxID=2594913 RepID=UPI001C940861